MIVPMKKYSFLVYHKEYIEFLKDIQKLGVVHVIENETGEIDNEELKYNYQMLNLVNNTIKVLGKYTVDATPKSDKTGLQVAEEVKQLLEEREQINQSLASLQKDKNLLLPWGNFDWTIIDKLEEQEVFIHFYTVQSRNFNQEWLDEYDIEIINNEGGLLYFILIQRQNKKVAIEAEGVGLPEESLNDVITEIATTEQQLEDIEKQLVDLATGYMAVLEVTKKELTNSVKFDTISLSTPTAVENKVMVLEGWVPKDKEEDIVSYLNESGVYFEADKPVPEDKVPIKLKNNRFARLYEAIGELYTFPDYKELDLTPFFAPFFMLFFGFCLGDAGYGLLILIGATIGWIKAKEKMKPLFALGVFLSIATIGMGVLGGSFFGINLIDTGYTITDNSLSVYQEKIGDSVADQLVVLKDSTFKTKANFESAVIGVIGEENYKPNSKTLIQFAPSKYEFLNSFRHLLFDSNKLMLLAILLGYIQIVFGMFLNAANKIRMLGFKYAVSQIGWIIIVMFALPALIITKQNMIDNELGSKIFLIALIIGAIPALFYNSPGKNPLFNFGLGIWDTYGMASGLLGDLLSYIRLFALGISSAVLGSVFNNLAFSLTDGMNIIARPIVVILILAFGHSLNLFMAALGSFVHPLRLTFVEFYKNAGFIGGGVKYRPFKKEIN